MDSQGNGEMEEISERLETSLSLDPTDKLEKYNRLVHEAKESAKGGDLRGALTLFQKANKIRPSEKISSRIRKIEELLSQSESEEEEEFVDVDGSGLMLFRGLHDKLYDYQKEGVAFLYSLYRDKRRGGILADDMGLGKTIQVISFLSGMYDADLVKTVLLIVPTSLIPNWAKEFAKWTPGMRVKEFHGTSKAERGRNLEKVQRRGGVLITTYHMILSNWQSLASHHGREFAWDYAILDEAHKIKSSSTKTAKSVSAVPSKNRLLLTGTPVQNNLREMWALFDYACQGTLLGTAKTFKTEYENPITRAREKDATPGEKVLGLRMSETLMATIAPYFLRRTKAEVQKSKSGKNTAQEHDPENGADSADSAVEQRSSGASMPELPRKNDLIVWTFLSAVQEDIYRQFLSLEQIQELLMTTKSPLAQLNILKKLCDHPRLLSPTAMAKLGLDEHGDEEEDSGSDIGSVPDDTLISESGKMVFLFELLERLREEGHRTLVFAQFRKVLDIIERILKNRGFKVMRLDGTITQMSERDKRITRFQRDGSFHVFLLTTKVGGVGITLTAADRVVIYDPSWNPATDAQAVDRAYRIGQKNNVVIYRLITCGTVEEKIYRRQVFKDSLIQQNTGDKKDPFRYFSKQELRELFTLEETKCSSTQLQLQALHSHQRRSDEELDRHIAHLHAMAMFGLSDHDLMFSVKQSQEEALRDQQEQLYIEGRVQKAQELVKAETELQKQLSENMVSSTEAAWLRLEEPRARARERERRQRSPQQEVKSPPMPRPRPSEEVVDLTEEETSHSSPPHALKIKTELGQFKQDLSSNEIAVIYDDVILDENEGISNRKTQENGFHSPQKIKGELPERDVSMNDNDRRELQNGDYSMNNLVIEDSIEEAMETSALKVHSQERSEQNGSENPQNITDGMPKVDESVSSENSIYSAEDVERSNKMDSSYLQCSPIKNKRLSALQGSFKSQNASKSSNGLDYVSGDFNLELGESDDMFSESNLFTQETEQEEQALLSTLQLEGSFDVDRSLTEHHRTKAVQSQVSSKLSEANESLIVTSKKKRAARIESDEDEEEEEEERAQADEEEEDFDNGRDFEISFAVEAVSTPKSAPRPDRGRRRSEGRAGLNTSVASRRSGVISLLQDMKEEEEEEDGEREEEEEIQESSVECVEESNESEAEEEELEEEEIEEEEEPSGETLHTEEEAEEEQDSVEESSADPELSSNEQMEEFSAGPVREEEDYELLVQRGRHFYHQGKQEEALSFFLRAIDIRPGDPEIQLLTIQLYRQLSLKK